MGAGIHVEARGEPRAGAATVADGGIDARETFNGLVQRVWRPLPTTGLSRR